jgi:mRNA interferase MazF
MAEYRRGDVVLVRFPFTDLRTTKVRPAIVLAVHGEDVVVIGIFSTLPTALKDTWLLIEERHPSFPQTGLKRSSVAKGEKVAVIHHSIIRATIGSLDPTLLDALAQRVKTALRLS